MWNGLAPGLSGRQLLRWTETLMTAAKDSASIACEAYEVNLSWSGSIAKSTMGIIAVESKFGRSPRYLIKNAIQRILAGSDALARLAPQARGLAQMDHGRASYLINDTSPALTFDVRMPEGAVLATALGLAKAASIHFPSQLGLPTRDQLAVLVITHNSGWMSPSVARLQELLMKMGNLTEESGCSGFVGSNTLGALDRAALCFQCPNLAETIESAIAGVPPGFGLTDPDLYPAFRRSELAGFLSHAGRRIGVDLDEPKFPEYRFRRWYTGWIRSTEYAREVLFHAGLAR